MNKKFLSLIGMFVVSIALVGCSNSSKSSASKNTEKHVENYKVYDTKVTSVSTYDQSDWLIKGTTEAPDGAKILVTPTSKKAYYYKENAGASKDVELAKAKNGKFTVVGDGIDLSDSDNQVEGAKTSVNVIAVTGLKKSYEKLDYIPKKILNDFKAKYDSYDLALSAEQANYLNSLDDDDSSSSSTDSSSASSDSSTQVSYTPVTYEQLARNENDFMDQKVSITGNVIQVQDDGAVQTIRVSMDDVSDSVVMVQLSSKVLNGTRVLEDDNITINGKYVGLVSYETVMGSNKTIPGINAKSFTINQ